MEKVQWLCDTNPMSASELSAKDKIFVVEYLRDFDIARAAKASGAATSEDQDPYAIGAKIKAKESVKREILIEIAKRETESAYDALYVIQKLKGVVESNMVEWLVLAEEGTTLEKLKNMPEDLQKMVTEIKKKETYNSQTKEKTVTYTFKFMDKNKALESLGKHKGLFDKNLNVNLNLPGDYVSLIKQKRLEREKDIIKRRAELEERQQKAIDVRAVRRP